MRTLTFLLVFALWVASIPPAKAQIFEQPGTPVELTGLVCFDKRLSLALGTQFARRGYDAFYPAAVRLLRKRQCLIIQEQDVVFGVLRTPIGGWDHGANRLTLIHTVMYGSRGSTLDVYGFVQTDVI